MKKTALFLGVIVLLIALFTTGVSADEKYQKPIGYVSDYAGVLPQDVKINIETKLRAYEALTSIQIVVVTIPQLTQATDFDEAQKIGTDWGIGQKGKDNGVILLFSFGTPKKVRIHPGYGLEGVMTDAKSSEIIGRFRYWMADEDELRKPKPAFSIPQGIEKFADEVIKQLGDQKFEERKQSNITHVHLIIGLIILVIVIIILDISFTGGIFFGAILNIALSGMGGGSGSSGFSGGGGGFGGGGAGGDW